MNEQAVSREFVELFSTRFDLYPECWLRHPVAGNSLRIDFIGFDKSEKLSGAIGFEIKDPQRWLGEGDSGSKYTEFSNALSQCIDYQSMLINSQFSDEKYSHFFGQRLRYTFLFPVAVEWAYNQRAIDEKRAQWAAGALRLAAKYGVGAGCEDKYGWILTIGTHKAFSLRDGVADLMVKHSIASRMGSAK